MWVERACRVSYINKGTITVIVNGNTYRLPPLKAEAIRNMPNADRKQLIDLLEALKKQSAVSNSVRASNVSAQLSAPLTDSRQNQGVKLKPNAQTGNIESKSERMVFLEYKS